MPDRSYNGDPVDLTFKSGPWANDGETVSATSDEDDGDVTTEGIDQAVDKMSDRQLATTIRKMRQNGSSYAKIREELGVTNRKIANAAFGRGRFSDVDCAIPPFENQHGIDEDRVRELRRRLLNGATATELASEFDPDRHALGEYARGTRQPDPDNPPAIQYSHGGGWHIPNRGSRSKTDVDDVTNDENTNAGARLTEDDVVDIRERLLAGESAGQVADDYPVSADSIRSYARGDGKHDPEEPPALAGNTQGEWSIKDGDDGNVERTTTTERTKTSNNDSAEIRVSTRASTTAEKKSSHHRVVLSLGLLIVVWWTKRQFFGGDA